MLGFLLVTGIGTARAQQGVIDPVQDGRVEAVQVRILNPSTDQALNSRVVDYVTRTLGLYPADRYSPDAARFALARTQRSPQIAKATHTIETGPTGGVIINVVVTLREGVPGSAPTGAAAKGGLSDFPILYDRNGSYVRVKLEGLAMYYGNDNAWYSRPDLMLAGNPLVQGTPAGAGYSNWVEGFVHAGLYAITPINDSLYVYGGLSGIVSASVGNELFTNQDRAYYGTEDAYAGVVGGLRTEMGDRFVFNVSGGRQKFGIGDGFLIINTAFNGGNRAALQSNPRWAADELLLASVQYNSTKLQIFQVDPDELAIINTGTKIAGINLETNLSRQFELVA